MSRENIITTVVAVLVVLGGAYYGLFVMKKSTNTPVVATIPSIATVNGVSIPKSDYDSQLTAAVASYKTQGVDVTDPTKLSQIETQVLDGLVNSEILSQAATNSGVTAVQADVDSQYQAILTQAGGADKLKDQLAAASLSDAKLRENIAKQLAIKAFILKKIDINSATTTPTEIKKFYDDNVKGQKGAPALKDISAQISQKIVSDKQQQLLNALISSLRATAKIEINKSTTTASTTPAK